MHRICFTYFLVQNHVIINIQAIIKIYIFNVAQRFPPAILTSWHLLVTVVLVAYQ